MGRVSGSASVACMLLKPESIFSESHSSGPMSSFVRLLMCSMIALVFAFLVRNSVPAD